MEGLRLIKEERDGSRIFDEIDGGLISLKI